MPMLKTVFSSGTVDVPVIDGLEESRCGAVVAEMIGNRWKLELDQTETRIDEGQAGPFMEFLAKGAYTSGETARSAGEFDAERKCYAAFDGIVHVPGLLRDIERCLGSRIVAGVETTVDVRHRFAGYSRVDAMCDTIEQLAASLPHSIAGITFGELRDALLSEGALYFFHGDIQMTVVFDMTFRERGVGLGMWDGDEWDIIERPNGHSAHEWMARCAHGNEHEAFDANERFQTFNPSNNRFLSYTATRVSSLPGDGVCELEDLARFADVHWRQMGTDGTDVPLFPPLRTIDMVFGLAYKTVFTYTRSDVWTYVASSTSHFPEALEGIKERRTRWG